MEELVKILLEKNLKITSAESCTGGLFSAGITAVSGSSAVFDGSFVTYSNEQKEKLLGVEKEILDEFGAVSYQTALKMAKGVREAFKADIGIGITGIAGPTGGSEEKPVGLVYISIAFEGGETAYKCNFKGSRDEVRAKAVEKAKSIALDYIKKC